jgi:hypothetical protein
MGVRRVPSSCGGAGLPEGTVECRIRTGLTPLQGLQPAGVGQSARSHNSVTIVSSHLVDVNRP